MRNLRIVEKCSDACLGTFGDVGWASGQVLSFRGTTEHLLADVPSVGFLTGWKWVVGGASPHSMTVPTTIEGTGQSSSGRWHATQQTDRHCCGRILTSRAHDPNRVAGQRKTGADFNSSVRGKPEAKLGHLVA